MKDLVKIPDLVAARVELHAAETRVRLETVKAQLSGEALSTALSRRLRSQRDRLAEELAAWEYLAGFTLLRTPKMNPRRPEPCDSCNHMPHVGGGCTVGHCDCFVIVDGGS